MKKHSGFTLVEILVAVVILAVGLLGLAGLQAAGLNNNQSAYNRSQATQLAYDIADRMRSNRDGAANYVSAVMLPSAATCSTGNIPCTACGSAATACTSNQLAVRDLFDWNTNLVAALPNVATDNNTITVLNGVYTVTITWADNKKDIANPNLSFVMSFRL